MTLIYYILSLLTTGLVSMILIRRLLDTIVLSPLTELSNKVREIGRCGDASKGFPFGNMMNSVIWQARSIINAFRAPHGLRENLEVANRRKAIFCRLSAMNSAPLSFRLLQQHRTAALGGENNRHGHEECLQDILKYSRKTPAASD